MNAIELALNIKGDVNLFKKLGESALFAKLSFDLMGKSASDVKKPFNLLGNSADELTARLKKTNKVFDGLDSSIKQLRKGSLLSDNATKQIAEVTKGVSDLDAGMKKINDTAANMKVIAAAPVPEENPGKQGGNKKEPIRKKTAAERNIAFMDGAEALANPLGSIFTGVMGAINKALPGSKDKPEYDQALGKIQEITGSIGQLQALIGEKLIPVAITVMKYLSDGFELIKEPLGMVIGWFGELYNWLESNKEIIEPFAVILGGFAIGIWAVVAGQTAWAAATTFLSTTMTALSTVILNMPVFGWIIAIIAAVIAAVLYLRANFQGFGEFFSNLWENVKASFTVFVSYLKQGFEWLWYSLQLGVLKLKEFGQYIEGIFSNIGKAIEAALNLDFAGAKEALTAEIKTSASGEIDILKKEHEANVKGYEKERTDAYAVMKAHPLAGIITSKPKEAGIPEGTDKKTGTDPKTGALTTTQSNLQTTAGGGSNVKEGINAVSGGGVKNITITVGKMFERVEFHIQNGTKQMAYELERIAEEAVTRAIASASSK